MSDAQAHPSPTRGQARVVVTAVVLVVCAFSNATFMISRLVGVRLEAIDTFVSEYGARGEPAAWFYRGSDLLTGTLLLAALALLWRVFPTSRISLVGQLSLGVTALLTITDSLFPLDCVPTVDAACRAAETARQVSLSHQVHGFTGIGISATTALGLVLFAIAWRRSPPWRRMAELTTLLAVIFIGGSLLIVAHYMAGVPFLGITQRVQIVTFSAFLIALAVTQAQPRLRLQAAP